MIIRNRYRRIGTTMANENINQFIDCVQNKAQNFEGSAREIASVMQLLDLYGVQITGKDSDIISNNLLNLLTTVDNAKDSMNKIIEQIENHLKKQNIYTDIENDGVA